ALDGVLERSSVLIIGGNGARLRLELMLNLGRADDARATLLEEEVVEYGWKLGLAELSTAVRDGYAPRHRVYTVPAYEWLLFLTSAARGDYDEADRQLTALMNRQEKERGQREQALRKGLLKAVPSSVGLSVPPRMLLPLMVVSAERDLLVRRWR